MRKFIVHSVLNWNIILREGFSSVEEGKIHNLICILLKISSKHQRIFFFQQRFSNENILIVQEIQRNPTRQQIVFFMQIMQKFQLKQKSVIESSKNFIVDNIYIYIYISSDLQLGTYKYFISTRIFAFFIFKYVKY